MDCMRYVVECGRVEDFQSFIQAMNDGFIDRIGGHWNGSLDAFNDYLSWPDGTYDLVLLEANRLPPRGGV
jgi:hypothetical protein